MKKKRNNLEMKGIDKLGEFILEGIKCKFVEFIVKKIWMFLYLHPILLAILPIIILIIFIIVWYSIMKS